jgi:hypothetical protein
MVRSTKELARLYLTAELRAVDGLPLAGLHKKAVPLLKAEMKRFPPIDDVVAVLDRIAARSSAA